MDLVLITWLDAEDFRESTWASKDEVDAFSQKICLIQSVGWIVKKTRHYVSICSDFTGDPDTHGRVIKIAKKMIKSIQPLSLVGTNPDLVPQKHSAPLMLPQTVCHLNSTTDASPTRIPDSKPSTP